MKATSSAPAQGSTGPPALPQHLVGQGKKSLIVEAVKARANLALFAQFMMKD